MTELSPRQRRYYRTKETILQAARELLAEKGLNGLSLREVARRIDYSPSGLYEYFNSKEDIVGTIRAEGLELLHDYLRRVPADLAPAERLMQVGLAYLEFAHNYPEYFRLIFTAVNPAQFSANGHTEPESPYHILLQAVQAVVTTEALSPRQDYSLEEIAYSLWSLVHGLAMLRQSHLYDGQADFEAIHRRSLQIFAEGLKTKKLFVV